MALKYYCAAGLPPYIQETNRDGILDQISPGLLRLAPEGGYLFCFRRAPEGNRSLSVNLVWFRSLAEGHSRLQRAHWYDYLAGTTEEWSAELTRREACRSALLQSPAADGSWWIESALSSRGALLGILLAALALFCWNYAEFFGPDSVYYFARRLYQSSDIGQAFSSIDDRGHYRPVGMFLFSFLFFPLFGHSVQGHHLVPLFFHVINVLLVYRIVLRLARDPVAAAGASLFFALHRVNFFVTYSITFIPDFTGMFFLLAAMVCYLKRDENRLWVAASLLLWLAALGSKEAAVVFPAILASYELLTGRARSKWELWRRCFARVAPFCIAALGFLYLLVLLRGGSLYPQTPGHPYGVDWSLEALVPKIKYLWWSLNLPQGSGITKLFVGVSLLQMTPIQQAYPHLTLAALILLLPFAASFAWFALRRLQRGNRMALFGVLYFLFALSPVLPLSGKIMQHNLYFPLFGPALLFGLFTCRLARNRSRAALPLLALVFLFSTAAGVINNRHNSWPVVASRTSRHYLAQFRAAAAGGLNCSDVAVVIAKTGQPDFLWHTDGGNLFRVFGPCPGLKVYFEDLGDEPESASVIRLYPLDPAL